MAGRKPKPTAIKQLEGNPGRRPLNTSEPRYRDAGRQRAPRHLPKDGQRLWRDLYGELSGLGLLTLADLAAFEMLCMHYALAMIAGRRMLDDGLVIMGAMQELKRHPAAQIWRENAAAFRQYAVEFGLTPSSRSKIHVEKEREQSLAEMLFAGLDGGSEAVTDGVQGKEIDDPMAGAGDA